MASIGGAMFVPIAGIISPSNVDAPASILLIAGVALGGRSSLLGPALGTIAVGYGRSALSEKFPTQWVYFQGALFILVILFLPGGVASLWSKFTSRGSRFSRARAAERRRPVSTTSRVGRRWHERQSGPGRRGDMDALEISKLTVDFDGFKAVDGIDLTFLQGRLHFLIGPNGAGKTTVVDALTGLGRGHRQRPTSETATCSTMKSHMIVRLGIGRTFQTASVFEQLSVLQNLDIAASVTAGRAGRSWPATRFPSAVEQALETIGLTALAHRPAGILAHGQKQWLEVGMLLVQDAKVMFLDETVAGMSAGEREETRRAAEADRRRPDHRRHRARHGVHAPVRRLRRR